MNNENCKSEDHRTFESLGSNDSLKGHLKEAGRVTVTRLTVIITYI